MRPSSVTSVMLLFTILEKRTIWYHRVLKVSSVRLKLFGKPGASRRIVETRRFEGQAKQVYSLLLLQKPYGCKPEPCIGRSLVQAQSQEPSKALVLRGFFIFIALVTRHDTPSSTGKSMAKTSPLLTSGRQVTVNSPMRGAVFPVSVWEYRANPTSRPWSGAWRSRSGSRGRWGPRRLRPGSRRAWRPWHRCRCRA